MMMHPYLLYVYICIYLLYIVIWNIQLNIFTTNVEQS